MVALAVVSRSQAAPPALPVLGDLFIVPVAAAAAWGHPADQLLQWVGSGWQPQQPRPGQLALVLDENRLLIFSSGWQDRLPVAGLQLAGRAVLAASPVSISAPQGGGTIDTQARDALTALLTALRDQGILLP